MAKYEELLITFAPKCNVSILTNMYKVCKLYAVMHHYNSNIQLIHTRVKFFNQSSLPSFVREVLLTIIMFSTWPTFSKLPKKISGRFHILGKSYTRRHLRKLLKKNFKKIFRKALI